MAKILPSTIISDIRGSTGGTVFSRNKGGLYIKPLVVPVIQHTPAQVTFRSAFHNLSQDYGSLSVLQKAGWKQYGIDFPEIDIFGVSRSITGQNAFLRSNMQFQRTGQTILSDAPGDGLTTSYTFNTVYPVKESVSGEYHIEFMFDNGTGLSADDILLIYMTKKIKQGNAVQEKDFLLAATLSSPGGQEPYPMFNPNQFGFNVNDWCKVRFVAMKKSNGLRGINVDYEAQFLIA